MNAKAIFQGILIGLAVVIIALALIIAAAQAADYRYRPPPPQAWQAPPVTIYATRPAPMPTVPLLFAPLMLAVGIVEAAMVIPVDVLLTPVPMPTWGQPPPPAYFQPQPYPPQGYPPYLRFRLRGERRSGDKH
jgi:hypothetical protein